MIGAMKKKIVILLLVVGVIFLASKYMRVSVYTDGEHCCALVIDGIRFDSNITFWRLDGNRWLVYPLGCEFLGFGVPKITKRDNFLVFIFHGKELGICNLLMYEIKYPGVFDFYAGPEMVVRRNADGHIMCATILGGKTYPEFQLTDSHIKAKCLRAIERKIKSAICYTIQLR